jgi:hypothetical protein
MDMINNLYEQFQHRVILFRGAITRAYGREDDPFADTKPETADEEEFKQSTAGRSFTTVDDCLGFELSEKAEEARERLQVHLGSLLPCLAPQRSPV